MDIYRALARGFLGVARKVTGAEVELMADAVEIIALELGIRFMTDYLRGDTYFKLSPTDPPDLNRTRAMVQLTHFEPLAVPACQRPTGLRPKFIDKIEAAGIHLPATIFGIGDRRRY